MKTLLLIIPILFCQIALAQQSYHSFEPVVCKEDESCLVDPVDAWTMKVLSIENRNGEIIGEKLSSHSHISDTVYPGASLCFTGESEKVCRILDMMSFDGDHVVIEQMVCNVGNDEIDLLFTAKYDMSAKKDFLQFKIQRCEN